MSDEEQTVEEEDEGKAYLRKQAVEYQMKIIRLRKAKKTLPPGGIIFYNLQVMLQATGDELQNAIAEDLGVTSHCVHVRLQIDKEGGRVIPFVDLSLPQYWLTGVKGLKGSPDELRQMAEIHTRGVVTKYSERFASIVQRRMEMFVREQ